jgi:hypothetical protein
MRISTLKPMPVWRGHSCPRNADSKIAHAGNLVSHLFLFAALTITPLAKAQRTAAAHRTATSHSRSLTSNRASARSGRTSSFRHSPQSPYAYGSLPFPFLGDSFNDNDNDNNNDIYSTGYPVASQAPPFLMQATRAMTGSATDSIGQAMTSPTSNQYSSSDPLMIELQNGRYVRVNNTADANTPLNVAENNTRPNPARMPMISGRMISGRMIAAAAPTLPPAVLIFHDGHSEEVRDYTIADGILYARGDYYTDGYWNKKINLSSLDLAQTAQANSTRNVNFILPSSPNEVITRP